MEQLACNGRGSVQLVQRNGGLVSSQLKDAVGRGVDDPLATAPVLVRVLVQHRGPGRSLVAQDPTAGSRRKLVDESLGESSGIRRERFLEDDAADFPVAGGAVLTWAGRHTRAVCRAGRRHRWDSAQITAVPD